MVNHCVRCGETLVASAKYCHQCGALRQDATVENINLINVFSYLVLFVSGIIVLNLKPYNQLRECRFHAWQSILLGGALVMLWVAENWVLHSWFYAWILFVPLRVGFFILWIVLMVKAFQNERMNLPIISELAQQKA